MNQRILMTAAALSLGLLIAAPAVAQPAPGGAGGDWGPDTYDVATLMTVQGQVVAVDRVEAEKGMGAGVHVQVQTDNGKVSVHLGPAWYIDKQKTQIAVGDSITATGSRVEVGGKSAVVAAEVRKGDKTLKLRDQNGYPVWGGWHQH